VRGRTSVTIVSGSFHTSARSVTKMPGTSHFPACCGPFPAGNRGPETRCRLKGPYRGLKVDSASVTVGQHGRKRGVPDVSVTGSDPRHGSGALPWRSRPGSSTPFIPGPLATATACPGAVARGPRPSQGASLRGHVPSGRQLAGPRPFPGASSGGPHSSLGRRIPRGAWPGEAGGSTTRVASNWCGSPCPAGSSRSPVLRPAAGVGRSRRPCSAWRASRCRRRRRPWSSRRPCPG